MYNNGNTKNKNNSLSLFDFFKVFIYKKNIESANNNVWKYIKKNMKDSKEDHWNETNNFFKSQSV